MKKHVTVCGLVGVACFLLLLVRNPEGIVAAQIPTPPPTREEESLGAIDVTLSLYRDVSPAEREPYEEILRYFADAIYEMSNGVHKVRNVTIYENGRDADSVDIVWNAREWPRAHISGYGLSDYHVIMGDVFPFSPVIEYDALDPANWRCVGYALGHEWGHYYYGLYDEYRIDPESVSASIPVSAPRPDDAPVQDSVMNNQWIACQTNDFAWLNFSVAKHQTFQNAQYRMYGAGGWKTLARPPWEDPRSAMRQAVRERTYFPELAAAAPVGDQDASLELVQGDVREAARSDLTIVWDRDARTETQQQTKYRGFVQSISGDEIVYPRPVVLVAQVVGTDPIAGAAVRAEAEHPDGRNERLWLADDGVPPDVLADDGLYSGYMPYSQEGTYSVFVAFDNTSGTAEFTQASYEHVPGPDGETDYPDGAPVGESFRVTATTDITVTQVRADDHGNTAAVATSLRVNNMPLTGRIDYAEDLDMFEVIPQATERLVLRVDNLAFGMQPGIRLIARDGTTVFDKFEFTPRAGEYFFTELEARANDAFYVGIYHLDETASDGVYDVSVGRALKNDTESPVETPSPPAPIPTLALEGDGLETELPDRGFPSPLDLPVVGGLGFLEGFLAGLPLILQWLVVILLILLLAFLLWRLLHWLRHRRGERKEPQKIEGEERRPHGPRRPATSGGVEVNIPEWIRRLTVERALSQIDRDTARDEFGDAVLIGLGPAGREVLSQVSRLLVAQSGGERPANVRLLQVEVQPNDGRPARNPPEDWRRNGNEWVLLRPDLDVVEENLRGNPVWQHWQWYEGARPTYDRARGRMALFHDLKDGSRNSKLWGALERVLSGLHTPTVRVVGSTFDDTSSGMLVDVARLTQIVANQEGMNVELWLTGPVGRDWSERLDNRRRKLRASEQSTRTLATLRELERFQRNATVAFTYVPPRNAQEQLRRTHSQAVVQSLFIFEPLDDRADPADDVLACMADGLLAMLRPEVALAWNQFRDINGAKAGALINRQGQGMSHILGSYTVRVPTEPLRQAVAWRMVRDMLFETVVGLLSLDGCQQDGQYEVLDALARKKARGSTNARAIREGLESFVAHYRDRWDSQEFASAVQARVGDIVNGERSQEHPDVPALARTDGLPRAEEWLSMLSNALRFDAQGVAGRIDHLAKDIQQWQAWLEDDVRPLCEQGWSEAREALERLRHQPARHWTVDEQLEWPAYRREIRSWDARPLGTATNEPLLQLAGRFGWNARCPADGQWRLHLIVPPAGFVWRGRMETLNRFTIQLPDADAEGFLASIYSLASPLARGVVGRTSVDIIDRLDEEQDSTAWAEKAEARIGEPYYNEDAASAEMGAVNRLTILVAPGSSALASRLPGELRPEGQFEVCTTKDTTSVTLLKAADWVPLNTHRLYDADAWRSNVVPPSMYVWRPEQLAAEVEGEQRLSPSFVARLAEDQELMHCLGLGLIYEVIHETEKGWHVPGMPTLDCDSVCGVLEAAFAADRARVIGALQLAIERRRQETAHKRFSTMQRIERDMVGWLERSGDLCERDLGRYLRGLVAAERG